MESPSTNPPSQGYPGNDEARSGLDAASLAGSPASACTSSPLPGSETETESPPSLPSLSPGDMSDSCCSDSIHVLSPPPLSPPLLPLRLATTASTTSTTSTTSSSANHHPAIHALDRKDGFFSLGFASPPKHQSPLRQSVSSIDCPDLLDGAIPHTTRFTARPSRSKLNKTKTGAAAADNNSSSNNSNASERAPEKAPERLLDRIRTSDLFGQSSSSSSPSTSSNNSNNKSSSSHNRHRSLFSPIEFKRSSTVEPDGWTTPSSTDKLSLSSPMRSTPFSFITSKMAGLKSFGSTPVSMPSNDELINMDIETALFPQGTPQQGESFTPAALMNLQITASGLLKKFQAAYQNQAMMIQELKAEKEAQDDEKAEADVRTRHLKIQLEDMARKASETETVMQALMEELNKEKRLREAERRKSQAQSLAPSEISEDLCVEEDQRRRRDNWRRSGETSKTDFSFETDEDSLEEASLFSRSRSPTLAPSIISEVGGPAENTVTPLSLTTTKQKETTSMPPPPPQQEQQQQQQPPTQPQQQQPQPQAQAQQVQPRPQPRASVRTSQPQMSAFQKLFKGISGDGDGFRIGGGCRNCQGQDASMAWDTVGLLRVENKGLKQRVSELESVVEDVLDVVNGVRREPDVRV